MTLLQEYKRRWPGMFPSGDWMGYLRCRGNAAKSRFEFRMTLYIRDGLVSGASVDDLYSTFVLKYSFMGYPLWREPGWHGVKFEDAAFRLFEVRMSDGGKQILGFHDPSTGEVALTIGYWGGSDAFIRALIDPEKQVLVGYYVTAGGTEFDLHASWVDPRWDPEACISIALQEPPREPSPVVVDEPAEDPWEHFEYDATARHRSRKVAARLQRVAWQRHQAKRNKR
jgi:hypothetical protein